MKPDRRAGLYPWYDSVWLSQYTRALEVIGKVRPEARDAFVDAFRVLRTRPDFEVRFLTRVFSDPVLEEIRRTVKSLRPADLELHESRSFGRFVVHDHPFFSELHRTVVPLVSEAVGEPVEPNYNFLSLYTNRGVCAVHMDSPQAKWTLDVCINQSAPWPIYFSQVQPWPELGDVSWPAENWQDAIKQSPSLRFTGHAHEPGEAVVFSGSSQWHYRDAFPASGQDQFCDLLFFHFIPTGASELIRAENWPRLFGIPELGATE